LRREQANDTATATQLGVSAAKYSTFAPNGMYHGATYLNLRAEAERVEDSFQRRFAELVIQTNAFAP
jgi:hypothetical protein